MEKTSSSTDPKVMTPPEGLAAGEIALWTLIENGLNLSPTNEVRDASKAQADRLLNRLLSRRPKRPKGCEAVKDMINLADAVIESSPPDIANWPATVAILSASMSPVTGLALGFDRQLPESWKWFTGQGLDNFQFTVWAAARLADGRFHAGGFVQMWQGRSMADGSLPAFLEGYKNWWGDIRNLWGAFSAYVPKPGDEIAVFVSAGNARLVQDVTSVRERSNVVTFALPPSDSGYWRFDDQVPQPTPIPEPPIPPVPTPEPVPQPDPTPSPERELLTAIVQQLVTQATKLDHIEALVSSLDTGSIVKNLVVIETIVQAIEQDLHGVKTVNASTAEKVSAVAANLSPLVALLAHLKS